jgi:hypothetical protein
MLSDYDSLITVGTSIAVFKKEPSVPRSTPKGQSH